MNSKQLLFLSISALSGTILSPLEISAKPESIRGWISDEQCARGRAESGIYTMTNGECAKQCVAKGKKIVLIDPDGKRILVFANQEIVKKYVGDYVEVSGEVDAKANTIHVDSLRFLDKNRAICGVEPKKKDVTKQP